MLARHLIVLLISISAAMAGSPPSSPLFKWNRTSPQTLPDGGSIQLLQRFVLIADKSYSIGSMTFTKTVMGKNEGPAEAVKQLKELSGFEIKDVMTYEGVTYVEAFWPGGNRILRFGLSSTGPYFLVSVSTYRPGYKEITGPESVAMQIVWHKYQARNGKKTSSLLLNEIFNKAYAASPLPGGFDISTILDSLSPTDLTSGSLSGGVLTTNSTIGITGSVDTNVNVTGLDAPVTNLGNIAANSITGIDGVANTRLTQADNIAATRLNQADNIANNRLTQADQIAQSRLTQADEIATRQLSEAERIANESMDRIDANVDRSLEQADKTTQMVDKNWGESNRQMERANNLASKLSDPKHALLLAGATAAGAVIGSAVANLAIEGVVSGLGWLIEQITDAKGKQERWKLFRDAREKWEETAKHARELEGAIDQFLQFNQVINTIKSRLSSDNKSKMTIENVIANFGREILIKQKQRERINTAFLATDDSECEAQLAEQLQQMDSLIANMGQVMNQLQSHKNANPNANIFDDRYFCDQLGSMLRNLVDAEGALQRYRMLMISGQTEWRDQALQDFNDLRDRTETFNDRQDGRYANREEDIIKDRYKNNVDGLKRQIKQACDNQREQRSSRCFEGRWNSAETKSQIARWEQSRDSELAALARRTDYRGQNPLGLNADVENQRLERYRAWFQDLEDQQFCSQNPEDKRCKEINNFRFNGVFYSKDRAFERMNQVCPGQAMDLPTITEKQAEQARAVARANTPASQGRTPAAEKKSGGFFSAIGDFFKNIFSGIGEFFGFGKSSTPGETAAMQHDLPVVSGGNYERAVIDAPRELTPREPTRAPATILPIVRINNPRAIQEAETPEKTLRAFEKQINSPSPLRGVPSSIADEFKKDFSESLKVASPEQMERMATQWSELAALPEMNRQRFAQGLYGGVNSPLSQAVRSAMLDLWREGAPAATLLASWNIGYTNYSSRFEWPSDNLELLDKLNAVPGIVASLDGLQINMAQLPSNFKNNKDVFKILVKIKEGQNPDLSALLVQLEAALK
jgi:hypothetical protein